jgi:hypothetical protein
MQRSKNKNQFGSTLAEFPAGLMFVMSTFLVVASVSWYLAVEISLKCACESAVKRAGACYSAVQSRETVKAANQQFHTGPVGMLLDNRSEDDGMVLETNNRTTNGANSSCRVVGRYHVRVLFCPWLIVASSEATSVLEHPEGYANVSRTQ